MKQKKKIYFMILMISTDPNFVRTNTGETIDSEPDTDVEVNINPSSSRISTAFTPCKKSGSRRKIYY
jgi:hypothetical protein